MKSAIDPECIAACADTQRAFDLCDAKKFRESRELLLKVRAWARRTGRRHGTVSATLAIVAEYLGDDVETVGYTLEAVAEQPLVPEFHQDLDARMERLRIKFFDEARKPDDARIPVLHRLLTDGGAADDEAHLRLARFHQAKGSAGLALEVVEAVLRREPWRVEAQQLRAELLRAAGASAPERGA